MLTESEYAILRTRIDTYDSLPTGANLPALSFSRPVSNEERSAVEVYEFVHSAPERYFAYVKLTTEFRPGTSDDKYGVITTWTGDKLGGIFWHGKPFRSNVGDERINIRVRAINGRSYSGTYYTSSGDYCRLRLLK